MARPSVTSYTPDGRAIAPKAIGYYKTYPEAMEALTAYNRNPNSINDIKFEEVFERTLDDKIKSKGLADSTVHSYRTAFNRMSELHKKIFRELKVNDLQSMLDSMGGHKGSIQICVVVLKLMYAYAMKYEIVEKDYSQYISARTGDESERGEPFTLEELNELKKHTDDLEARLIICMCYTGFRISAYEKIEHIDDYLKGGVKTKQSKGRIVPIHDAIKPWIDELVGMPQNEIRYIFKTYLEGLGISHTPHDCRHTFSYLCDKYEVNPLTKRMLMGHTLGSDVSDIHYGHRSYDQLKEAISMLKF